MNHTALRARRLLPVLLVLPVWASALFASASPVGGQAVSARVDSGAPDSPVAQDKGDHDHFRADVPGRPSPGLETIRRRVIDELLEPEIDESRIESLLRSLRTDGTWPHIDYDDVSRTGFQHRTHVANLAEMSRAYRKAGSRWYRSPELKGAISSALDFWIQHDFIGDNWHSNEIANPEQWSRVLLLMDDALSERHAREVVRMASRANLQAWGARPGGDLIKIAGIMANRALFLRDEKMLERAVEAMAGEIEFTTGNGMKPDYSFNHRSDRVTSTLSYGNGYAAAFADWAPRLAGTRFRFPGDAMERIIDFYLDGISASMVHGRYPDPGAINRQMSRRGALRPVGPELPRKLLAASTHRAEELERIVRIRTGEGEPDLTGNRFFWHSEYLAHQRPGYFTSVRMFSARNHNMESPYNSESLKHHHYADGSNFLSRRGDEYLDIFPIWDWQKIPGTTVVQKPALPGPDEIVKQGLTDFVGGVSDGRHGAAAFDFASPHDPLVARKAWFFFDREFAALGSGIRSDAEHPVATTLNQSLLQGDVVVRTGRGQAILEEGEHTVDGAGWVHHDGTAYLFPAPTAVRLDNRVRRGAWREITHQAWARNEPQEASDVFALWLDHGPRPREATYEYVVVPGIDASAVEAYRSALDVRVLANTAAVQAVRHHGLNLSQAVFYEPGEVELAAGITVAVEQPGLVMVEASGGSVQRITVADPTRELRSFRLRLSPRIEGEADEWTAAWNDGGGYSEIAFQLPGGAYAGRSVVMEIGQSPLPGTGPGSERGTAAGVAAPNPASREGAAGGRFVGERHGGGVVFWVDGAGTAGLAAAPMDQSAGARWSRGDTMLVGAAGDGIGAGATNTRLIIASQADGDTAPIAAQVCADYRGGGFDDWYLPSRYELDLMNQRRKEIGGFENAMYWSSTEYNIGFAWEQLFYGYSGQFTSGKGTSRVRCVRQF